MAGWVTIPDSVLEAGDPVRSIDALALRDNPIAITERAAGAPRVKGTLASVQTFTADGTWTKPTGVTLVMVEVIGAGGGGGSGFVNKSGGGGGGGGGHDRALLDVTTIATSAITINAAGVGGAVGPNPGTAGGSSIWSDGTNTLTSTGGAGGLGGTSPAGGLGGVGGTGTGGDVNTVGAAGLPGETAANGAGGTGGHSALGAGGIATRVAGAAGVGFGGGGAGGGGVPNAGGAGSKGIVVVTEYF